MLEETLIVFFSDHGDMLGDHHLWRKSYPYQASAQVPFLLRWPTGMFDAARGRALASPIELRDVLPTFLDAAGTAPAHPLDGRSLLPLVSGRDVSWRPWLDLEHGPCYGPENHWNALSDGRLKYIFHAHDAAEQLFEIATDPGELRDLAPDPAHAVILREWRARMTAFLAPRGEHWVKSGELVARAGDPVYSPNYPKEKA
jgi:arylsulfatase A-like enzyme